jgi:hypothetical protein
MKKWELLLKFYWKCIELHCKCCINDAVAESLFVASCSLSMAYC